MLARVPGELRASKLRGDRLPDSRTGPPGLATHVQDAKCTAAEQLYFGGRSSHLAWRWCDEEPASGRSRLRRGAGAQRVRAAHRAVVAMAGAVGDAHAGDGGEVQEDQRIVVLLQVVLGLEVLVIPGGSGQAEGTHVGVEAAVGVAVLADAEEQVGRNYESRVSP